MSRLFLILSALCFLLVSEGAQAGVKKRRKKANQRKTTVQQPYRQRPHVRARVKSHRIRGIAKQPGPTVAPAPQVGLRRVVTMPAKAKRGLHQAPRAFVKRDEEPVLPATLGWLLGVFEEGQEASLLPTPTSLETPASLE